MGWAMLSLPVTMQDELHRRWEDMLRVLAEQYGTMAVDAAFGHWFSVGVGVVIGLLLLSAVNTAVNALIGVMFMMSADGEMPRPLMRLNRHGVPLYPLLIAVCLPIVVLIVTSNFESLMNLGSCTVNLKLPLKHYERGLMGLTFLILAAVELTLAKTKPEALFFVVCILVVGLAFRAYSHKVSGLKTLIVTREVADVVSPEAIERLRPKFVEGQRIMVSARGITPVLRFALDEAKLRKATLCVLFVKEVAVFISAAGSGGRARWQDDPEAAAIMCLMLKLGTEVGVDVLPVYAVSTNPAGTILDLAATMGVDYLMLGASHRLSMARLLKGNVVEEVARGLPEDIQLLIYG
jgi:nucleotide-binding universal stress UspA family protein